MELKFNSMKEFADQRIINRVIYENMCYNEKRELKEYIYNVLTEKGDKKDLIWEYLNEPRDSDYYVYTNIMLASYSRRNK